MTVQYGFTIMQKITQFDAQLILSIFRQPLHISGISVAQQQEVQPCVYNNWYLLFFLDDSLLSWLDWNNPTRTTVIEKEK